MRRFLIALWLVFFSLEDDSVQAEVILSSGVYTYQTAWYKKVWNYVVYIWYRFFYKRGGIEKSMQGDHGNLLRNILMFVRSQPKVKDRGSYFRRFNRDGIIRNKEIWKYH